MVLLAGFVFAGATLLEAQDGPPPAQSAGEPEAASSPAPESGPAAGGPSPSAASPSAPATTDVAKSPEATERPVGSTPNRFEPTEKVRADFDVSFPVDI
jgi:hypothetical protein